MTIDATSSASTPSEGSPPASVEVAQPALYTTVQLTGAAALGGPFAVAAFVAANDQALGRSRSPFLLYGLAVLACVTLVLLPVYVSPITLAPLLFVVLVGFAVVADQGAEIELALGSGTDAQPIWPFVGRSLLILLATHALLFALAWGGQLLFDRVAPDPYADLYYQDGPGGLPPQPWEQQPSGSPGWPGNAPGTTPGYGPAQPGAYGPPGQQQPGGAPGYSEVYTPASHQGAEAWRSVAPSPDSSPPADERSAADAERD